MSSIPDQHRNAAASGLRRLTRDAEGRAALAADLELTHQLLDLLVDPDTFVNVASVTTNLAYGLTMNEYTLDMSGICTKLIWMCLSNHDDRTATALSTLLNLGLAGKVYRREMFRSEHLMTALNFCLRADWSFEMQCRAAVLVGCLCGVEKANERVSDEPAMPLDAPASAGGAAAVVDGEAVLQPTNITNDGDGDAIVDGLSHAQCVALFSNSGVLEGLVRLVTVKSPHELWVAAAMAVLDVTRTAPDRLAMCVRMGLLEQVKNLLQSGHAKLSTDRKMLKVLGRALRVYDPESAKQLQQNSLMQQGSPGWHARQCKLRYEARLALEASSAKEDVGTSDGYASPCTSPTPLPCTSEMHFNRRAESPLTPPPHNSNSSSSSSSRSSSNSSNNGDSVAQPRGPEDAEFEEPPAPPPSMPPSARETQGETSIKLSPKLLVAKANAETAREVRRETMAGLALRKKVDDDFAKAKVTREAEIAAFTAKKRAENAKGRQMALSGGVPRIGYSTASTVTTHSSPPGSPGQEHSDRISSARAPDSSPPDASDLFAKWASSPVKGSASPPLSPSRPVKGGVVTEL